MLEVTCILQKREATVIRQCHDGFTDPELYSLSTLGKHVSKGYFFLEGCMNKKQRILIESLTNANARITRLENENSLLHVRINTLEQFLNKYGERITRLEVIDKVCTYENEAEHNKVYPNKIDSLLAKHMTKVFK